MLHFSTKTVLCATAALLISSPLLATSASAGKMERVDIVKEGIDTKAAIVKATGNGYAGFENTSHRYMVRLFAKARGSNAVYATSISRDRNGAKTYFKQLAPVGTKGWGVYKKSVVFDAKLTKTHWWGTPGEACRENLKNQMAKGLRKEAVLSREWQTKAIAVFYFGAAAAKPSNIKKGKYNGADNLKKALNYPVKVICRAAR